MGRTPSGGGLDYCGVDVHNKYSVYVRMDEKGTYSRRDASETQQRKWLFVLAYNLGNFMRRLTLPESVKHWSLRSVQTKLIKIGGRLVRHARRLVFQLAEVAVSQEVFRQVLERIGRLCPAPG